MTGNSDAFTGTSRLEAPLARKRRFHDALAAATMAFGLVAVTAHGTPAGDPGTASPSTSVLPIKLAKSGQPNGARFLQKEATLSQTASTTTQSEAATLAIRPFHFHAPDEALVDLRRRIAATKWPSGETVADDSQGVQLATMRELARYWHDHYDWRKFEARLNTLPQFTTNIDGLEIHFIHVRSKHPNALPLILTHGWPGSIIEELKIIDPLTNPTAHGGTASDAFDVVIPSLPGHGFSGKPTAGGWNPVRIARAWIVLMKRLGYTRFVAQGGDWGNAVTEQMALLAPPELLGIHTNMPAAVPTDIAKALLSSSPAPAGLAADERHAYEQLDSFYRTRPGVRPGDEPTPADAVRN